MKKLKLMTAILAMTALLVCTVALFSPYAPVVGPVPDIEDVWAIEDAREESDTPLVTALENNGMRLGYDAQENTFYCPVGLDNGEEWPELRLSAPGAKGVQLAFADDYAYDWCEDAVRDGVGFLKLDDFANQVEFADLTTAFNDRIKEEIIFARAAVEFVGKQISFHGCISLQNAEPDSLVVVPVELGLSEG